MIFRGSYNIKTEKGLILADVLLAMSLAVLFIVLFVQSFANSRDLFEYTKEHNKLMDIYNAHAADFEGMTPYESRSITVNSDGWKYSTTTISAYAHWYGNDRIQTDIKIQDAVNSPLVFNAVRAYPLIVPGNYEGTPLCSVGFSNKNVLGSYGYQHALNLNTVNSATSTTQTAESNSPPNPQGLSPIITPISLPISSFIPLTDLEVRNSHAYISTDSSNSSDPDIIMADIHDPANVDLNFDVDTGPGLSGIALAGNRIFAAMTSRTAQLQVIKISYLGGMLVESSYKLPLPYATATPSLGSAIFYDNNYVYLGTEKWDGEEFSVIDVSNPTSPVRVGSLEIGSKVNSIFVRDGIAYVTSSDQKQLRV
ncbi:MAG: hypothetical protein RL536_483, partial [Candidatus Parcubacteria bacterium]